MSTITGGSARTPERVEFLADIITTAVEGGITGWARVDDYDWHQASLCGSDCGHPAGDPWARATLVETATGNRFEVTVDEVDRALAAIAVRADLGLDTHLRKLIRAADDDSYAGDIDASAAIAIVEIAWFGKVVYC